MLEYEYYNNASDKLIIIFQGALHGSYTQYPYGTEEFHEHVSMLRDKFYWFKLQEKVDANYLFVKDTTNNLMGWYAFADEKCIVDEFNESLSEKIKELGFERENVYTFGSSKGGFAALLYGVLCDLVGHVVTLVPQIEIGSYIEKGVKEEDRREYLQKSFEKIDKNTLNNVMYSHIGNKKKIDKPVYILTGSNDTQYSQILEIVEMISGNCDVTVYDTIDYSLVHSEIISENTDGIYRFLCSLVSDKKATTPVGFKIHAEFEERLGIICDINWYHMFADYIDLVYITPSNVDFVMDKFDKVLYITTWVGAFREYMVSEKKLVKIGLLKKLKENGKEIIFYSKEDPVNYDSFYENASLADEIYTSSRTTIENYRKDLRNDNVNYMPYHINSKLFNPTHKSKDYSNYHFAGSYIAHRYEDRKKDFDIICNSVIKSKKRLFIRDRNQGRNLGKNFEYPEKFRRFVHESLKYEELSKEQCDFQNHVNLNSVKFDQDMCAVRVYELQAAGKTIHSNYSLSVSNKFPNINIVSTEFDFDGIENIPKFDMTESDSTGVRNIFSNDFTVDGFINKIYEKRTINPKILVVFQKDREFIQSYKGYETVKANKMEKIDIKKFDFICFIGDGNYSYYYIEDLINGFKYSNTTVVSTNKELHFEIALCTANPIRSMYKVTEDFTLDSINEECEVTFISNTAILEKIVDNEVVNPILSIVIPIYNNGKYLRHRCLKSLKRLKYYKDYEILLIDDGSTDEETLVIISEEEYKYSNVKVFRFNDGGSGSASRPRNKGLDLATSKYIAYLDPDNEHIGTGFEILLEKVMQKNLDFCFGKIQQLGDFVRLIPMQDISEITNKQDFFDLLNFRPLSIQGAVFEADFLRNEVMKNPEGLIGEDTLFCFDTICSGKKFEFINRPIHKYYSKVEGSVTNVMTMDQLKGGLEIERIKRELFEKYDLLDLYIEKKNDDFIKLIYVERLKCLPIAHYVEGVEVICGIIDIYGIENIKDSFLRELYFSRDGVISIGEFTNMWARTVQKANRHEEIVKETIKKKTRQLESANKRIQFLNARVIHFNRVSRNINSEFHAFKKDSMKREKELYQKVHEMRLKSRAKRRIKKLPFMNKILK